MHKLREIARCETMRDRASERYTSIEAGYQRFENHFPTDNSAAHGVPNLNPKQQISLKRSLETQLYIKEFNIKLAQNPIKLR